MQLAIVLGIEHGNCLTGDMQDYHKIKTVILRTMLAACSSYSKMQSPEESAKNNKLIEQIKEALASRHASREHSK